MLRACCSLAAARDAAAALFLRRSGIAAALSRHHTELAREYEELAGRAAAAGISPGAVRALREIAARHRGETAAIRARARMLAAGPAARR